MPTPGSVINIEALSTGKEEFTRRRLHKLALRLTRVNSNHYQRRGVVDDQAANNGDGIGDSLTVTLLVKRPKGTAFGIQAEIIRDIRGFGDW